MDLVYSGLVGRTVFFGIEHFGEARVFLEEGEIFVVASVISIFGAELDSDLQIFHGGVGFASKAVESGESVVNVVSFGCRFSCLVEAFAGVIPTADIHHSDATLIVFFGGLGILLVAWLHALLGDLEVHASAVGKLFARAFENFFKFGFGFGKLLLVKERQSLVVELQLSLNARVDQFDATALGRVLWS